MPLGKLMQKPHIALKEQLQIIEPILQHGDAVHAQAKGEAGNLLRVITILLHKLEDIWIDHAAAQDLDPAGLFAGTASIEPPLPASPTDEAGNEHFRARLGEREERRAEAGLHI